MTPTLVTPSDSSCAFGGYTGCLDGEFGLSAFTGSDMSSSVSSSDSDDSLKDGNVNDPPSSTRFLQYKVVLQHVGDEALQLYLEDRPTTVVNQSKFSRDRKKRYSYRSCVCGCNYRLVIIFSVDDPSTIESRETAIPSSHDMKLSQAIPQRRPMNREVRDTILQLLEQNRFTKNYGPKRIMSELRRRNISEICIPSRMQIQNMISYHRKSVFNFNNEIHPVQDKLRLSVYAGDEAPDKAFVFVYDVDENNWYVLSIYVSCSHF
jgi:hypothetical protein